MNHLVDNNMTSQSLPNATPLDLNGENAQAVPIRIDRNIEDLLSPLVDKLYSIWQCKLHYFRYHQCLTAMHRNFVSVTHVSPPNAHTSKP